MALRLRWPAALAGVLLPALLAVTLAATAVDAAGAATVALSRSSGSPGTSVTATYTAPGCGGGVAATVAFSLDAIDGHQFGNTTMNPATCVPRDSSSSGATP